MSIMMDESASQERLFVGRSGSVSKLYLLIWKNPKKTEYVQEWGIFSPFMLKEIELPINFKYSSSLVNQRGTEN